MAADDAPRPRRFIGRRAAAEQQKDAALASESGEAIVTARPAATKRFVKQQVPDGILYDEALNEAIAVLPTNYNFEIHKTVARIRQLGAKRVALQFPEGLLMYACIIADILESHAGVEHAFVMGDVTYGACCVDDFSAKALGADLLVHYGHSCLVPVDVTKVPCMYVFVDITVDVRHLTDTVRANFPAGANLVLAGTIQFGSSIQAARRQLEADFPSLRVPQAKPLSPGEVLGCTAPVVAPETDAIVFVADGRFHLEAIMIANPAIPAFRYDPYAREITAEHYDQAGMRAARRAAVEAAAPARQWGVVLGTLGRQGNPRLVKHLQAVLAKHGRSYLTVLLSEVVPSKLALFNGIDAWVQVACPRLSIDWGEAFATPTLTPYEALVALGEVPPWWQQEAGSSRQEAAPVQPSQAPSDAARQVSESSAQRAALVKKAKGNPQQAHMKESSPQHVGLSAQPVPPAAGSAGGGAAVAAAEADAAAVPPQPQSAQLADLTLREARQMQDGMLHRPQAAPVEAAAVQKTPQTDGHGQSSAGGLCQHTDRQQEAFPAAASRRQEGDSQLQEAAASADASLHVPGAAAAGGFSAALGTPLAATGTSAAGETAAAAAQAAAPEETSLAADKTAAAAEAEAGAAADAGEAAADVAAVAAPADKWLRQPRQQFDLYRMDYYAREGGQWNSYYAPAPGTGSAAKLAALRAARAAAAAAQ